MALSTKVDFLKDRFDPFTEIYSPLNISDEQHTIPSSSPFYVRTKETIKADSPSSIEIWTGAGKTGDQYTEVSSAPGPGEFQVDYKFQSGYIRFNEANGNTTIYITYKGLGDVIQALHINTVQDVLNLDNVQGAAGPNKVIKTAAGGYLPAVVNIGSILNSSINKDKLKRGEGSESGSFGAGERTHININEFSFFPWLYADHSDVRIHASHVYDFSLYNGTGESQNYNIQWDYISWT